MVGVKDFMVKNRREAVDKPSDRGAQKRIGVSHVSSNSSYAGQMTSSVSYINISLKRASIFNHVSNALLSLRDRAVR